MTPIVLATTGTNKYDNNNIIIITFLAHEHKAVDTINIEIKKGK